MNARAVAVMREAGVDITGQRSKHVDELKDVPFDYVVTVCGHANETCPRFPGKTKVVHVGFDDPPQLAKGAASDEEALRPLPPRARRDPRVRRDAARRARNGAAAPEATRGNA